MSTIVGQSAMRMRQRRNRTTYFPFEMGLNLVDPVLELKPGVMLDGENYEVHYRRGYERAQGYERYDGTGLPSDEPYVVLPWTPDESQIPDDPSSFFWTKTRVEVDASAVLAPDGTSFAYSMLETELTGAHLIRAAPDAGSERATFSASVKDQGRRYAALTLLSSGSKGVLFDLEKGIFQGILDASTFVSIDSYGIEEQGDGWFYIWVETLRVTATGARIELAQNPETGATDSYPGNEDKGIYLWHPYFRTGPQPQPGDTVTGATSGATGKILKARYPFVQAGETETDRTLILVGVSGTFEDGENLQINSETFGTANGTQAENEETDDTLHNEYLQAAAEWRRNQIAKVPGSGPVRGVWKYLSDIYAFRDTANGDECRLYKATTSGWEQQDLGSTLGFYSGSVKVPFNSGSEEPDVGDTLEGATSGATGIVVGIMLDSGDWSTSDAAGVFVLNGASATAFDGSENINISGGSTNIATNNADPQNATNEIFEEEVITGSVSGATATVKRVILQSGAWDSDPEGYLVLYDVSGTFLDNEVLNGNVVRLPFNSGSREPEVGDEIEGASSGATGTVKQILPLDSGSWNGEDADGTFLLENYTGTFDGTETLNNNTQSLTNIATNDGQPDTGVATVDGQESPTKLLPGGRYEFTTYNFRGHENTRRVYGADGVNNGLEWDGSTYVPIRTGMENDAPVFLAAHKKHLFYSFSGGSLQNSSTGDALVWSAITGASEIATGEEITGLVVEVGDVLSVFCRSDTYLLYGTSVANWNLQRFHQGSGAIKYTTQKMGTSWLLDDEGVKAINATEAYGDFQQSTMTGHIQPFIDAQLDKVQASVRVRKKNQYRVYFSDKTGLIVTMENNQLKGATRFRIPHQINVIYSIKDDEDADGNEQEEIWAGSDDGYVYKMESGPSFDGESVLAWFLSVYAHYGSPLYQKIFRGVVFEMDVASIGTIQFFPEFDYGDDNQPSALRKAVGLLGSGGRWNVNDWDTFLWSAPFHQRARIRLDGAGQNMAFMVISEATYEEPHVIQGASVEYAMRRLVR